jgi:hypothetical protein
LKYTPSASTLFRLASGALALLCVGVYAAGLHGPFLMDDFDAIFPLAAGEAGAGWWDALQQAPHHIRARWLSNASFLLTQALTGSAMPPQAFAYKLGNLALHLACTAVVVALARRLLNLWGTEAGRARWLALLAGGMFAVHPLLLSTVLYPVQRMAQLATLFALLAVLAYVHWRRTYAVATARQHAWGVARVVACTGLALLSKESGALTPLLIGVVELTCFRWPSKDDPHRSRFDTGFGVACAAPLVLGFVMLGLRWKTLTAGYEGRDFTLPERLLTQMHVLLDYLGQIVWPRIGAMGLYRDDLAITTSADAPTLALAVLFALAVAAAIALRRRWSALSFGVLWFFAAHALESTVLPLEMVFEHRNYLALFGPALAGAWAMGRTPNRLCMLVATLALAGLSIQTARRAFDWRDQDSWIRSEAAHHPGSLRAGTGLVIHFFDRSQTSEAGAALDALRHRFPEHAQTALLGLALRCKSDSALKLDVGTTPDEMRSLRSGVVGKDAFHLFVGLRDRKLRGECEAVGWPTLAAAAGALANNPAIARQAAAAAAWHRLQAQAASQAGDAAAAAAAVESALAKQDNDPRDWLLLMQARLQLHDLAAYDAARARLLRLTGGNLGRLRPILEALDSSAAAMRVPQP